MNGVKDIFTQDEEKGVARISIFNIDEKAAKSFNLRQMIDGNSVGFINPGNYVMLHVDGELMMSDTPFERRTNEEFVRKAKGKVMIAGLGIGMILNALRDKVSSGEVTEITVYEKYQDVIDVVYPKYQDMPLKVICQDILTYKPDKSEIYDTIYFDIWPTVGAENLKDIRLLHNRWKSRKPKDGWMDSWMKKTCQKLNRADY